MENQLQADLAPIFRPATVQELVEFLREHPEQKLLPVGGNTKPSMSRLHGRKATQFRWLRSKGVIDYQPADFTVTVAAGTKVESLNRSLSECGQFLPFDPPFASSGATVGGVVAAGLNGPCRMLWGDFATSSLPLSLSTVWENWFGVAHASSRTRPASTCQNSWRIDG